MDPVTSAAIISGGAQIAGGLLSGRMSYRKSLKLADYAYGKDLEMWNRMNEYNLPANQMKRLAEAGLNPNMMYGTGQGANVAKEMPKYQAPTAKYDIDMPNVVGMLSAYQDIKIKKAQVDNLNAQTQTRLLDNKLKSGTLDVAIRKAFHEADIKMNENVLKAVTSRIQQELYQDRIPQEQAGAQLRISQATAERAYSEAELKKVELGIFHALERLGKSSEQAALITNILKTLVLKR